MRTKTAKFLLLFLLILFGFSKLSAQVTIGSKNPPSKVSLLDLDATEQRKALHNARLTSAQRDALVSPDSADVTKSLAKGLLLYNIDNNCLEFWNGARWVSLCDGDTPDPCINLLDSYTLCYGKTIADLSAAVGAQGIIQWYSDDTQGGVPLDPSTMLTSRTYYAGCGTNGTQRIPVSITLVNCLIAPSSGHVTTFVNVMYDFQHQTLEAHSASSGGAVSWQWQVSEDNINFTNIQDAPNSRFFTIPAGFADNRSDSLYFRCILSNPTGMYTTTALNILFISTKSPRYGIKNGVRYLTIEKGGNPNGIRIALLNLGAGEDKTGNVTNDAGDLGDFFQWGRVADGHQHTVWSKSTNHTNHITPFSGGNNATSVVVSFNNGGVTPSYNSTDGQVASGTVHYGNFISSGTTATDGARNWHYPHNYRLWGNGLNARTYANITPENGGWIHPENNPCPTGWRIPCRWNIWDIYAGDGSDTPPEAEADPIYAYAGLVNQWHWRESSNNAYGGVIITNRYGDRVFLPAAGRRMYSSGTLESGGLHGYYWSSTQHITDTSFGLHFTNSLVYGNHTYKGYGYSIRCVAE